MAKARTLKFDTRKAGSAKKIKADLKKQGGDFGRMLWIKADDSKIVRILAEPKDWEDYGYVVVEETDDGKKIGFRGKLPAYGESKPGAKDSYADEVPEARELNVRRQFVIPVAVIDSETGKVQEQNGIMFWAPGKKIMNDVLNHFDRRKTVTDRDLEIVREGSGREGTTYTVLWDDPKKRTKLLNEAEIPDFSEELVRMVGDFMKLYSDDEDADEDEAPAKSKGKAEPSNAKRKAAMEEPEEDDEPEDEPDEEPEPDEDDESDDESDEDEGDEDDEDESEATEPDEDVDDVKGVFTVSNIDVRAGTVDLADGDGVAYTVVYLDSEDENQDVSKLQDGKRYTMRIKKDEDDDWVAVGKITAKRGK